MSSWRPQIEGLVDQHCDVLMRSANKVVQIVTERLDVSEGFDGPEEVKALKDSIAGIKVALIGSRGCWGC